MFSVQYKPLKCLLLRLKIMEYRAISEGRGYVYAHLNQLYKRVRTVRIVRDYILL